MLPTFLVIGAEKAGTTWIYNQLRRHPDVFMPSVKELHLFNRKGSNLETSATLENKDLDWYEYHFRSAENESAVGEATPMYLCDPSAPTQIYQQIPDVKLIACLRYPTDRAYSHYWMARGKEHTNLDFEQVVRRRDARFIERGRYGQQLERYLSFFDRDQLLILIHEEVFSDPSQSLTRVCSFLGVDNTFYQDQSWIYESVNQSSTIRSTLLHRVIGATATWMRNQEGFRLLLDGLKKVGIAGRIKQMNKRARNYPEIPEKLRSELDEYYAPTVQHVEQIIGRRIDSWRS